MNLQKKLQNNAVRFYHVGTNPDDFKSFFKEGAKPVGQGVGGQANGFYVWSDENLAENHIQFLNFQQMLKEAIIVGIDTEKEKITYPLWQADVECAPGLCDLFAKHQDFINKKMQNLNIQLPKNESLLTSIQSVQLKKENDAINLTFKGASHFAPTMQQNFTRKENDNPCQGYADAVFFQTLTDYLCQNNPDFKQDYNRFMQQSVLTNGIALKYTGKENLPISSIEYATIDDTGKISKTSVFDKKKQFCPFVAMALKRKTK